MCLCFQCCVCDIYKQTEEAVENAVKLNGSTFKGRTLKVTHKRVNDHTFYHQQGVRGGGRGGGGRGRFGGAPGGRAPFRGGRGRGGRGFRGGYAPRGGYHPYYY